MIILECKCGNKQGIFSEKHLEKFKAEIEIDIWQAREFGNEVIEGLKVECKKCGYITVINL